MEDIPDIVETYDWAEESFSGFSDVPYGPAQGESAVNIRMEAAIEAVRTGILLAGFEGLLNEAEATEAAEAARLCALDEEEIAAKNEWEQSCELGKVYVDFAKVMDGLAGTATQI